MPLISLRIHHSQFPENVRFDLLNSLRTRKVNHKFHYDSIKQAQKWLALHEKYSPARTDRDCLKIYQESFRFAAENSGTEPVQLIGLGCGGGQKEAQFLELYKKRGLKVCFMASDVSSALTIIAQQRAAKIIGAENCDALVCDLETANDLPEVLSELAIPGFRRVITFFGLIPNFEPHEILAKLSSILRSNDLLLFSANLAPGADYSGGMERIFPLYDNELTRDWLITFLRDLGMEEADGEVGFQIESIGNLQRIRADFHFVRRRELRIDDAVFVFESGDTIRLFFSYRHTPETIRSLLADEQIEIVKQWITPSEEEGVFCCRKMEL